MGGERYRSWARGEVREAGWEDDGVLIALIYERLCDAMNAFVYRLWSCLYSPPPFFLKFFIFSRCIWLHF